MTRAEHAKQLFEEGYACSQAIGLAFIDLTKIDEENMKKLTLPLGGGLGRLRLTCGAVSSMAVIIGLIFAKSENTHENKLATYKIVQELVNRFIEKNKTVNCAELLILAEQEPEIGGTPEVRRSEYYNKRPCGKIVYNAAKVLEEYLKEQKII